MTAIDTLAARPISLGDCFRSTDGSGQLFTVVGETSSRVVLEGADGERYEIDKAIVNFAMARAGRSSE